MIDIPGHFFISSTIFYIWFDGFVLSFSCVMCLTALSEKFRYETDRTSIVLAIFFLCSVWPMTLFCLCVLFLAMCCRK